MTTTNILKDQISKSKNIAIIGHIEPDADALSSMIAIKKIIETYLEENEKKISLFAENFTNSELYEPIIKNQEINTTIFDSYDIAISVDCANKERLGKYQELFSNSSYSINIDHHDGNTMFGDANYVYKCSSTCEIVYVLIKSLNLDVPSDILKLIYSGIITDTQNLTQGSIRVSTYKVITEIVTKVNDMTALNAIKDHFLKNNTINKTILLQKALHSMNFYLEDRLAIMKLTKADFDETEASNEDTLGIVDNAINIKGVFIAMLFIKQDDGSYYISMRSKNGVNISPIAKALGGGGNETVGAFSYGDKLSELKPKLLNLCNSVLQGTEGWDTDTMFD